ncbi:hypothetical protein NE237_007023 [Protea cynaroides]|uniref:DUF4283 domain-containing protein n=1 Tax=Protea cynaroides TaxID=273540 RepID=A0A9Q0KNQ9_9MAGN|nr:hypothetical protein NE237_007023 [Protea cynaroides]
MGLDDTANLSPNLGVKDFPPLHSSYDPKPENLKNSGYVEVLQLLQGGCAFRFSGIGDRDRILEDGVFYVGGQPMFLRQWEHSLHSGAVLGLKKVPLWVTLPGLPLHLWGEESLSAICSVLGVPLYSDSTTAMKNRWVFARVCVKFSGESPMLDSINIKDDMGNLFIQPVKYEWKPPHCVSCGVFGHHEKACTMTPSIAENVKNFERKIDGDGDKNPKLTEQFAQATASYSENGGDVTHERDGKHSMKEQEWTSFRVKKNRSNGISNLKTCSEPVFCSPSYFGSLADEADQTAPPTPAVPSSPHASPALTTFSDLSGLKDLPSSAGHTPYPSRPSSSSIPSLGKCNSNPASFPTNHSLQSPVSNLENHSGISSFVGPIARPTSKSFSLKSGLDPMRKSVTNGSFITRLKSASYAFDAQAPLILRDNRIRDSRKQHDIEQENRLTELMPSGEPSENEESDMEGMMRKKNNSINQMKKLPLKQHQLDEEAHFEADEEEKRDIDNAKVLDKEEATKNEFD